MPFLVKFSSLKKTLFLLFPLFSILAVVFVALWFRAGTQPRNVSDKYEKSFLIVKGSGVTQIGKKLESEGIIKNALIFRVVTEVAGKTKKIQAGEYTLKSSMTLFEVIEKLVKGPDEIWVTIPEGFRREEVGRRFAESLSAKDKEVFVAEFLTSSNGLEGYLFPDTYLFPKTATPAVIVKALKTSFDRRIAGEVTTKLKENDRSLEDVVILASILERETLTDSEKPIVAGIYYNRLKASWPLQADATLQYAVVEKKCLSGSDPAFWDCKFWRPVTPSDKAINSAFNTYKFPGLPSSPIASPGLSSIVAAIEPEATDYWFYIHDSKGVIHYAKTLEEHNENIAKFL